MYYPYPHEKKDFNMNKNTINRILKIQRISIGLCALAAVCSVSQFAIGLCRKDAQAMKSGIAKTALACAAVNIIGTGCTLISEHKKKKGRV